MNVFKDAHADRCDVFPSSYDNVDNIVCIVCVCVCVGVCREMRLSDIMD